MTDTAKQSEREETPKGFYCKCEVFHAFDFYVYAHMKDRLTHTCKYCGAQHTIQHGRAALKEDQS